MAYYSSGYHDQTDFGEYYDYQTSYTCSNYFGPQGYEPSIYNLFDYDPTPYNHAYNNQYNSPSWSSYSTTAYCSNFAPTEPKFIQHYYDPNCYRLTVSTTYYDQTPQTQLVKSHLESEFNAPEFEEYDPTPYGGGYDIVQTYGKPLPPSDQICYPRGGGCSQEKESLPPSVNGEAKGNGDVKPEEKPPPPVQKESQPKEEAPPNQEEEVAAAVVVGEEEKRHQENGQVENNGLEYGNEQVISQIPSGYGLEAMDLCESFFGFWPCHTRYYARRGQYYGNCQNACGQHGCYCNDGGGVIRCGSHQGYGAADYLFGSSDPYVERRDGGGSFGLPIHCYERRYQEQPLSVQVEFDQYDHHHDHYQEDNSWSQNFRIF